jgi:hypothetical protein
VSTRNLPGGKGRPAGVSLTTSLPSVIRLSRKCEALDVSTLRASTTRYRDSFTFMDRLHFSENRSHIPRTVNGKIIFSFGRPIQCPTVHLQVCVSLVVCSLGAHYCLLNRARPHIQPEPSKSDWFCGSDIKTVTSFNSDRKRDRS